MPVIDFHVHVLSSYDDWTQEAHKLIRRYNPAFYEDFDNKILPEGVLNAMKEDGVDYSVILPEYAPLTHGTITNEFVSEFCESSDRLIPFCNINPHIVKHPGKELSRLVDGLGVRGVKLIPTYNHFYANEAR